MTIYTQLQKHAEEIKNIHMRDLFASDSDRFNKFHATFNDFLLDYSKNNITQETMDLLMQMAKEADLQGTTKKMFSGERINTTENRPVLHIALRNRDNHPILVDGKDVMPQINAVLNKMHTFSDSIRDGKWLGFTGKRITNIVNIGIGGSDLGPAMAIDALKHYKTDALKFHFVSNVDGTDITDDFPAPVGDERLIFGHTAHHHQKHADHVLGNGNAISTRSIGQNHIGGGKHAGLGVLVHTGEGTLHPAQIGALGQQFGREHTKQDLTVLNILQLYFIVVEEPGLIAQLADAFGNDLFPAVVVKRNVDGDGFAHVDSPLPTIFFRFARI